MKKCHALLLAAVLCAAPAFAQETSRAAAEKSSRSRGAAAEPASRAEPAREKRSFLQRVFGRKKPDAAQSPTAATPAPQAPPRPRRGRPAPATPAPEVAKAAEKRSAAPPRPKLDRKKKTESEPEETDSTEPAAAKADEGSDAPPPPETGADSEKDTQPGENAPPADADPETQEKWKYDQAKLKAQSDPQIQKLKEKADSALSEEEARPALRAYNKALFAKMRKADPSIKERVNRMEAAVLKQLGE